MYPNIVSLSGFNADGFYQNEEADILLNTTTGWFAAALIRVNSVSVGGVNPLAFFSSLNVGFQGVHLAMNVTTPNVLDLILAMGTGVAFVQKTIQVKPATLVGSIIMPWALWNGTNFIVGLNGEQFEATAPAATFQNNTTTGMFIGTAAGGAADPLSGFGEVSAIGFINTHILDAAAAEFASRLYAASERVNDLSTVGTTLPDFDYLISMQRQAHAGLQDTFENLGTANGGDFAKVATEDSEMVLRTSPTHWSCPVAVPE